MPRYVDGFDIPIARKNVPAYRRMATLASRVWMDHGALEYFECVGEELAAPYGKPFNKQVKLARGETIVFAWIVFRSKAQRNKVNAAVMKDPRLAGMDMKKMPFDVKKMVYGGFDVMVEARPKKRK
jgi:uncharacterized protein YbaA (DUF1428 family)